MTVWRPVPKVIAAMAVAGFLWFATTTRQTLAAGPTSGLAAADPVLAARDVFQDRDFWWKRIEPRAVSTSWLDSILAPVLDFIGRVFARIWELIARFLRSLYSLFAGASSGGTVVVWLIVAAFLAWSIWKLGPVIVRWLMGNAPAPGRQEGVKWQALAEASDLFEQAGQAFRDGMFAEAIRLALLALIARLEKQGLLRYDTTRTNREYQIELGHRSELALCFGQLARIYERVWYGRLPAGRAEAEQAISLCEFVMSREELAAE